MDSGLAISEKLRSSELKAGTRAARLEMLAELGSYPPWWRPFARRRWRREYERFVQWAFGVQEQG